MKKLIVLIGVFILYVSAFGQNFNGIAIDGNLNDFVAKMKSKGYQYVRSVESGTVIMSGMLNGDQVEFWISGTPKTKKVWKLSIYFSKVNTWYSIKNDYDKSKEILAAKYGQPDKVYEFFSDPYYDGDGYEMTAVKIEKATFASYWINERDGYNIGVSISKFCQIRISYENSKNYALLDQERNQINNATF